MANCSVCHKEMYESSNGSFSCRNFDCPPGTEAKYHESWKLVRLWKPILLEQPSGLFSVKELRLLNQHDNAGITDGFVMQQIGKRLKLSILEAKRLSKLEDQKHCWHSFDKGECTNCGQSEHGGQGE